MRFLRLRCLVLHPEAPLRSDDVDVARASATVVLSHAIYVESEMFVEGMVDAGSESIPHPNVEAPVIKHLVADYE